MDLKTLNAATEPRLDVANSFGHVCIAPDPSA